MNTPESAIGDAPQLDAKWAGRNIISMFSVLAVAALLLLLRLEDVVAVTRDESAFALFANEILNGLRPLHGFYNIYTSPVHSYIIAGFFAMFGDSVWSLRISGVIFNLLAVLLYADLLRRISWRAGWLAAWILISSPAFVVMARMAGENFALNPFLLLLGAWLFLNWGEHGIHRSRRWLGYFAAGVSWGLLAWNHVVTLPSLLALAAAYMFFTRPTVARILPKLILVGAGFLMALVTDLYQLSGANLARSDDFHPGSIFAAGQNFLHTFGGDAWFIRICGEVVSSFLWVLPIVLLLSALNMVYLGNRARSQKLWMSCALFLAISFVGTWVMTPDKSIGSRIWLLPLWGLPVLIAISVAELPKRVQVLAVICIVACNLTAVGLNYFAAYPVQGGAARFVDVGGRQDNSWDYADIRPMVAKLSAYGNAPIFIEDLDTYRLRYLLAPSQRGRAHTLEEIRQGAAVPENSLIVLINLPERNLPYSGPFGGVHVTRREALSSNAYVVLEVTIKK